MFQNRRGFLVALFAVATMFGMSMLQSQAFAFGGGGGGREPRVEGILVAVSGNVVSVRTQNGVVRTLAIPAAAKVERNGVRVPLTAFKINDRVQARFTANGATVVKFEGVGP